MACGDGVDVVRVLYEPGFIMLAYLFMVWVYGDGGDNVHEEEDGDVKT